MFDILHQEEYDDVKIEILQFPILKGSSDIRTAETLFYTKESGMRLKMIRITLNNSKARIEPGAIYYMHGHLEMKASTGGGIMKGLTRKLTSGETFFVNEVVGTGVIYLEPTFGHFFVQRIGDGFSGVICDKGMFFAGAGSLDIGAAMQKNISSALLGGEGLFQTSIKGRGVAILYSPVPMEEIVRIDLNGDKLAVDGNFALMRTQDVEFRVEKSSKNWISTAVSGEGLFQTFSGKGSVWIAPTQSIYEKMASSKGLHLLSLPPASRQTTTQSSG